jgi:ABC-type antimicrobial peptide transport system permease subunit
LTLYIQGITTASLVFTLLIFAYVLFKDFAYFYQKRKRDFGIFRSVGLSPASSSFRFVSRYILLSLLSVVMGAGLAVLAMNGTESFVSNNMGVFNVSAINSVVVSAVIAFSLFATIAGTMIVFARNACRMKIADLVRFDE